jgi:hypothetical protein
MAEIIQEEKAGAKKKAKKTRSAYRHDTYGRPYVSAYHILYAYLGFK